MSIVRKLPAYAAYVAVRTIVCVFQAIPIELCERASRHVGWLAWHLLRLRRGVIEENLAVAFPEATAKRRAEIAVGMWRHLLLMLAEIAQAPRKLHRTNWRDFSTIPAMAEMTRRFFSGRPVVVLSGHLGNFEMGGYLLGLHGFPTYTVARTLDNPYLDRWINEFRGATGQYMLSKTGCGPQIAELLANGQILVLLGDQAAGEGGCWIDFFGKPASTHKAVGVFTVGSGAPTTVCAALRTGGPLQFELKVAAVLDPLDDRGRIGSIADVLRWYSAELENLIRQAPEQYWWVHRRWKGRPPERKRRAPRLAA